MIPAEVWLTLNEHPAYSVSNLGRVRRDTPATGAVPGRILRSTIGRTGYFSVLLSGVYPRKRRNIHRMVAEAFIPRDLDKPFVNHKNGIKTDNRVGNLEWVSRRENEDHAMRIGLKPKGESIGASKLTEADVREIRSSNESNRQLASRFMVRPNAISRVRSGACWKHVPMIVAQR